MKILFPLLLFALLAAPAFADREPKLGLEEAASKAKAAAGGGPVERASLEQEGERLLWAFEVRAGSDAFKQVWLDADTGELVRLDSERDAQREVYARATRRQLDELQAKIEALKKQAGERSQEARKTVEKRAAELEVRRKRAEEELARLESSGRERWRRFKTSLDRALAELRGGYEEALSTGPAKSASGGRR